MLAIFALQNVGQVSTRMNFRRTIYIKAFLSFLLFFVLYACSKKGAKVEPAKTKPVLKDIYICGESAHLITKKTVAKYWKNGVGTFLTDGANMSSAAAIAVVGRNIYVSGYESVNNIQVVKLWKNGVGTSLSDGITSAQVSAMAVSSNNEVYVGGHQYNNSGVAIAKYWKNGALPVLLGDGIKGSYLTSIVCSGTDVYATGYVVEGDRILSAKLWKNGVAVMLAGDSKLNSYAQSVILADNDVYVAGGEDTSSKARVKYWKNGASTLVTDGKSREVAAAIAVNGADIYIVGLDNTGPKYWKNGIATSLPVTKKYIRTYTSLFLLGSDVYVFGNEQDGAKIIPKYWYNGIPEFILPDIEPSAMMYGAFVTTE